MNQTETAILSTKLSTWYKKYRIVTDAYLGYEVQTWWILWPFWIQAFGCKTFQTIEKAESYARKLAQPVVKEL